MIKKRIHDMLSICNKCYTWHEKPIQKQKLMQKWNSK